MIDVQPELPILIRWTAHLNNTGLDNVNNIVALGHHDRVCEILVDDPTDYPWEEKSY